MNAKPEKVVAFLDLLGFSEAVSGDLPGAVRLLQDYAGAITDALRDGTRKVEETDESATPESRRLMELMTVNSFENLLPMSDSVFVVASDASKFILQLSHFLMTCFQFRLNAFANPEQTQNPMAVTTRAFLYSGEQSRMETEQQRWWPVLFRGGISVGKCQLLEMPTIADNESKKCRNLIGEAVVQAVKLEKLAKGPRILCSLEIQKGLQVAAAAYVGQSLLGEKDCVELYWPMAMFEDTSSMADAINNHLREWIQGVANLYLHFRDNQRVCVHYEAYLRLLVASALRKYPTGQSELKKMVDTLQPDLVEIAFFPATSQG
jgi:hypothetical protein